MPSPFPGMDPYLEGYLWPDVHAALANKIRQLLTPQLPPHYVARLEISVVEDGEDADIGVMYPDVEVVETRNRRLAERAVAVAAPPITAAPLLIPLPRGVRTRLFTVEVRDSAQNVLVTSIEILSPVNKRKPGLRDYREKRRRLYVAGVHLLELDLLRRGERAIISARLPDVPYLIALTRARATQIELWPLALRDPLPIVAVPLRAPDADLPLDLAAALTAIYDEAAYDRSIDYTQPPTPPLSDADAAWARQMLQ